MKRRQLIQQVGTGVALGSVAPALFAGSGVQPVAVVSHSGMSGVSGSWLRRLGGRELRLELESIRVGQQAPALDIDAVFEIEGRRLRHRLLSYRPGEVSPLSQLFGFRLNAQDFVGFEIEQPGVADRCIATSAEGCQRALSMAYRSTTGGRFLLSFDARTSHAELWPLKGAVPNAGSASSRFSAGVDLNFRIQPVGV